VNCLISRNSHFDEELDIPVIRRKVLGQTDEAEN